MKDRSYPDAKGASIANFVSFAHVRERRIDPSMEASDSNHFARFAHQRSVEMQVVEGKQTRAEHLIRFEQVAEIGT